MSPVGVTCSIGEQIIYTWWFYNKTPVRLIAVQVFKYTFYIFKVYSMLLAQQQNHPTTKHLNHTFFMECPHHKLFDYIDFKNTLLKVTASNL